MVFEFFLPSNQNGMVAIDAIKRLLNDYPSNLWVGIHCWPYQANLHHGLYMRDEFMIFKPATNALSNIGHL